jgi:hypothetical protein
MIAYHRDTPGGKFGRPFWGRDNEDRHAVQQTDPGFKTGPGVPLNGFLTANRQIA